MTEQPNLKLILLLLTIIAGCLRLYALGDLGFRWDEDLTSIAVKAVVEHGYPLLDSGMVYPRFLPLQYLLAGWTTVFGFSEFTIRLPIALFGTALIPLVYVIGRDLLGPQVGLIAAAIMAFDFWQVELARTARMYAPFFLVYGLFFIAVYRGLLWDRRTWRLSIIPIGLLAILLHDVGLFCAGIVLLPALLSSAVRRQVLPYAASVLLVAFTAVLGRISDFMWRLALNSDSAAASAPEADLHLAGLHRTVEVLMNKLDFLHFPDFELLRATLSTVPGGIAWVLLTGAAFLITLERTRGQSGLARIAALGTVGLALLHQFTLSLLLLACFAALQLKGTRAFLTRPVLSLAAILVAIGVFWAAGALALGGGLSRTEVEYFVKALFEYPRFRLAMAYPLNRPLMTVLAALGALLLFDKVARPSLDKRSALILGAFLLSYLPGGMFASRFSHFRYVLHADFLFVVLAGAGIWWLSVQVSARRPRDAVVSGSRQVAAVTMAVMLSLLAGNPVRSALAVSRDYQATAPLERWMDIGSWPDYKTTAAFIRSNRRPGDQVLVLESREYYNYLGGVDAWIRSDRADPQVIYRDDGIPRDRYIGVPVLQTLEEVKAAIDGHDGRTWLPFNARVVARGGGGVDGEIAAWLEENRSRRVMTGRDNARWVYLFDGEEREGKSMP